MVYLVLLLDNNKYITSVKGVFETEEKAQEYIDYFKENATWRDIIRRCCNPDYYNKHSEYAECTICDEWLNFQNFAAWHEENYYDVGNGERMHIDKDILIKSNKIYSPETCLIVPQRINMIFMTKAKKIDQDLPNAIYRHKNKYKTSYNGKWLGLYPDLDEAINAHDTAKRIHIKNIIKEYGEKLSTKVRNALLAW